MKRKIFINGAFCLLCAGALIADARAGTIDAELEALEREIEQQEQEQAEAAKQAEAEVKRKAEAAAKQKAEEERQRAEEASQQAEPEQQEAVTAGDIELVDIPGGTFQMGCSLGDTMCLNVEFPVHSVTVKPFRMGKYEITVGEYRKFTNETGHASGSNCNVHLEHGKQEKRSDANWDNPYFNQSEDHPVVCVSWNDAVAYTKWLSHLTGRRFRLPTEAEWEYAARAGAATLYWWGNLPNPDYANFGAEECCSGLASGKDKWIYTAPVGSFPANPLGLHDMQGNATEWMQDCWNDNYNGAPTDGSAWLDGDCSLRQLRGASWAHPPRYGRVSYRGFRYTQNSVLSSHGFRVAEDKY